MRSDDFMLVACERDGRLAVACERSPDIDDACAATVQLYDRLGFEPPWIGYVTVEAGVAVGGGAFVGPPADGRVEIAYFTLPQHQSRGVATRTATRLVEIARATAPQLQLFAKTLPQRNASTRLLERLGFAHVGSTLDHEVGEAWAWVLR